ncbi:hypothetical protein EDB87DRAFT_1582132 [Lactarius vividus]|nr:hypothetical protein EDB87DRAFT_1582132 [Lactarius vividus]
MKQGRAKISIGRRDFEDVLGRPDRLTQQGVQSTSHSFSCLRSQSPPSWRHTEPTTESKAQLPSVTPWPVRLWDAQLGARPRTWDRTGLLAHAPFMCKYTPTDPRTSDSLPVLIPLLRENILSTSASATVIALDQTLLALRQVNVHRTGTPDVLFVGAMSGVFDAAGLGARVSVKSGGGAISVFAFPPGRSVESLLQALSLPSMIIAPILTAIAAAAWPTHRVRHDVDAPVLAPKDASALLRHDSSPALLFSVLVLALAELRCAGTARAAGKGATYVRRRSIPNDSSSGGDGDSRVSIPFPRAVSGEYGGAPSLSSFNTPLQSQSPSFDRAPFNELLSGNVNSPLPLLRRGRFQSEVDGESLRRRPHPNSYDQFGAKPWRSRFESMVNLSVVRRRAQAI